MRASPAGSRDSVRVHVIGPLPPPMHGQSMVTQEIAVRLNSAFPDLNVIDTAFPKSARMRSGLLKPLLKAFSHVRPLFLATRVDCVYLSVNANNGMWLTTFLAFIFRLKGARIFLHHHSYSYVRARKGRMVALALAAGESAFHLVLSRTMARDLARTTPEVRNSFVLGNACFVDGSLLSLPEKTSGSGVVLGHLSNLTLEKGIAETIDLAIALQRVDVPVRLIVGGPIVNQSARDHLDRASRALGPQFEYRGPLGGASKLRFFEEISHFVFPTGHIHEAVPLVLFEALAAGAICLSTRQGSVAEQLEGSGAILADTQHSFVNDVAAQLLVSLDHLGASKQSRKAFVEARALAEDQLRTLVAILGRV